MPVAITGDSQAAVAYALMQDVLRIKGHMPRGEIVAASLPRGESFITEHDVLALFHRCLSVVRGDAPADPAVQAPAVPLAA